MASVQKRPDGRWRARYRDPMGRERARHFARKVDAEQWLDSVTADRVRGEYIAPEGARVLFGDRYERCVRSWVNLCESTRARDEGYGRSLILPTFGKRPLGTIDHDTVQDWAAERTAAYSGLRAGELYGLRRERVNAQDSYLHVLENLVEVTGHINFGPPNRRPPPPIRNPPESSTDATPRGIKPGIRHSWNIGLHQFR